MTNESEKTVTGSEVHFFYRLSVLWGACILPLTHAYLQQLASGLDWDPFGLNTVSPWTSIRIGLVGGAFTSPLVLGGAYFPTGLLDLECAEVLIFLAGPMIIIGGIQGFIGSMVLYGRSVVIDGQEVPDVLGTSGASVVGYMGGLSAFVAVMIFVALRNRFLRLTLCKQCTTNQDSSSTCNYIPPAQNSRPHSCLPSRSDQRWHATPQPINHLNPVSKCISHTS